MGKRAIGIKQFLEKEFDCWEFEGDWKLSLGKPEKNFKMCVYGDSGNGKTSFCIKLAKYLAGFTRVYYNSFEEGISKTLQDALVRENMMEVQGKVVFGDKESFKEVIARLKRRNSPRICFIDSRDYMKLTTDQYKELIKLFPRKSFILICWSKSDSPKGEYGKDIEYMADIKIKVTNYIAEVRSRFGGNTDFVIWAEGAAKKAKKNNTQRTLF